MQADSFVERYLNLRTLIIFSSIFLLLRLLFAFFFSNDFHSVEDYRIAENIVKGIGFVNTSDIGPTAMKVPVYPLFIALIIFLFGTGTKLFIIIIQHVLMSLVPLMLYKLGKEAGSEKHGYIASYLFLFYPSYFYYPSVIEVTNLFVPLFVLWCVFVLRTFNIENKLELIITGILSGIVILTQPIIFPIVFCYLIALLIKRKYIKAFIIFMLIALIMSPWIYRNYKVFDSFIPTKSPIWLNVYVGIKAEEYDKIANNPELLSKSQRIDSLDAKLNDVVMQKEFKNFVINFVKEHPVDYLKSCMARAFQYWTVPSHYYKSFDIEFVVLRIIPVLLLNIFFIFGIFILWRQNKISVIILAPILFYFTLVYCVSHARNIRFKLDIEWLEFFSAAVVILKYIGSKARLNI